MTEKIPGTTEAWESGLLGRSAEHAQVHEISPEEQASIDECLGLKMISIRLENELIDDFKFIAKYNHIRYQTMMRQALKRFAESEIKRIAIEQYEASQEALREAELIKKAA